MKHILILEPNIYIGPGKETHISPITRAKETCSVPDRVWFSGRKPTNLYQEDLPRSEHEIQPITVLVQAQGVKYDQFPPSKSSPWKNLVPENLYMKSCTCAVW